MTSDSKNLEVLRIQNMVNEDIPEEIENNVEKDTDSEFPDTLEDDEHNSETETNNSSPNGGKY